MPATQTLMQTTILNESQRKDWDSYVESSPDVIAWHSWDWSQVLIQHYGCRFYPIAAYDGGRIRGILPLYHVKTFRSGDALMSIPYVVAGGAVADSEEGRQALLAKAIDIARETNIHKLTLKQYKVRIAGDLFTEEGYYNRELTLSPDINAVWNSISAENRAKVEQSRAHQFTLEYPSKDLDRFYRMLLRDQHAAGVPCMSKSWVRRLYDTGMYEISLLKQGSEIVAGTMVKKFKDTVSFPFTCLAGTTPRHLLGAYSLYWQIIERLATEGIRICHSGRIPNTDQALPYRLGWGGTKYPYLYQYYGVAGQKTEFAEKRGRKRELFETVWKHIPVPVARMLAPPIVKQFP